MQQVLYPTTITYRVFQKKCTNFMRHHFATVYVTVMRFAAKCSERNCLHDKCQSLNTAIKYSLFCSWPVNFLKTKLSEKSLRQIRGINKVHAKPAFQNLENRCSLCRSRERIMDDRALINKQFSTIKCYILLFKCR